MGQGSASPVGYQFLTCPPPPSSPPSGPPVPQPTTSSYAPIATHSHPPTHSNRPSNTHAIFVFVSAPQLTTPAFSLRSKNCHCFAVTFSWCLVRDVLLGLFYDKCVSQALSEDVRNTRKDSKEDKAAEQERQRVCVETQSWTSKKVTATCTRTNVLA